MPIGRMAVVFGFAGSILVPDVRALPASRQKTYINSRLHYALKAPAKWNIEDDESVPVLFNFKESEGGPQGLFPDHGAVITVIPLARVQVVVGARTMEEWIRRNITSAHSAVSIRRLPAPPTNNEDAAQDVVEVEADFQRDRQDEGLQHEISYYYTLRGAIFRLTLLYWKGDSRSAAHRAACQAVLDSIRATR